MSKLFCVTKRNLDHIPSVGENWIDNDRRTWRIAEFLSCETVWNGRGVAYQARFVAVR